MPVEKIIPALPDSVRTIIYLIGLYVVFKTIRGGMDIWAFMNKEKATGTMRRESDEHIQSIYSLSKESIEILRQCAIIAKECVELHKTQAKMLNDYFMTTVQFRERVMGQMQRLDDKIIELNDKVKFK